MTECPFDSFLARTPYLVVPKLALQAMPLDWRERFVAMLTVAYEIYGLETPEYHVFRKGDGYTTVELSDSNDDTSSIQELFVLRSDPWANYRHGSVKALCPSYTGEHQ